MSHFEQRNRFINSNDRPRLHHVTMTGAPPAPALPPLPPRLDSPVLPTLINPLAPLRINTFQDWAKLPLFPPISAGNLGPPLTITGAPWRRRMDHCDESLIKIDPPRPTEVPPLSSNNLDRRSPLPTSPPPHSSPQLPFLLDLAVIQVHYDSRLKSLPPPPR